jgi:hypothetical protein
LSSKESGDEIPGVFPPSTDFPLINNKNSGVSSERGHGRRRLTANETSNLGETWSPTHLPANLRRRDAMQEAVKSQQGRDTHQEPKDPRGNPIEQSSTPVDPAVDPLAVGHPKPPFGGPEGGDQDRH